VREDPANWSLSARPGYLRIITQEGDLWGNTNDARNLFLLNAPPGDFEISTQVTFAPGQAWQQAVLLIYGDDGNYVRVDRVSDNAGNGSAQMVVETGDSPTSYTMTTDLTTLQLKLRRTGTTYTGFYSADGATWTQLGQSAGVNLGAARAGLSAWNSSSADAAEIPADFDWFCLNGGVPGPTVTPTPPPTVTPTPSPTATATPTWQTIFSDGFEGGFPEAWQRRGNPGWGRTDCRLFAGTYSVWPAADGTDAVIPCTDNYPNNVNAWLIIGPFDLTGATAAEIDFQRWQRTELDHDYLKWLVSVDDQNFYGWQSSGNSGGWDAVTFDLSNVPPLGDLRGRSQVWVAFAFTSDGSGADSGAFLDDVVIRKQGS